MPEALVIGVGAIASAVSAAVLSCTFFYVVLYFLLYKVVPVVSLYAGVSLLNNGAAFCERFDLADAALASPCAHDVVGALLVAYAAGAFTVTRTGCQKTMLMFTGAVAGASWRVVANGNVPETLRPALTQFSAAVAALAFCHLCSPLVAKQLGTRKPKYEGYA